MALQKEPTSKNDHAKKQELIKELQLLKIKEQNFEREKGTHIYSRQGDMHSELGTMQQLEQSMAVSRKSYGSKMNQMLLKAKDMVRKFRRELENASVTPEFLEKLKFVMEEIENEIAVIKEQQKTEFDELAREERVLNHEVESLERRFETWLLPSAAAAAAFANGAKSQRVLPSSRDITADLPPEVAAFEVSPGSMRIYLFLPPKVAAFEIFLQQTGGHRGGWDDYDHNTFIKYRNRHKGKISFIKELASGLLPTRTEQEIRDHEAWFQDYTQRNDRKKEVIQKWRERKEIEREEVIAKEDDSVGGKKKADEEEKREEVEREKALQRQRLNLWKVEKEQQKAAEEEKRLKKQLDKQRQLQQEKQRQMELRQRVSEYKVQKEKEEEEMKREELERLQFEVEEKQQQAAELISRFRDREAARLEAVREKRDRERREKDRIEQEKQQRLERLRSQAEINVERDPQRLLRPTEGWKERQKDIGPSGTGPLLHIPHRFSKEEFGEAIAFLCLNVGPSLAGMT